MGLKRLGLPRAARRGVRCPVRTAGRTISKILRRSCLLVSETTTFGLMKEQLSFVFCLLTLNSSEALQVQSPSALHAFQSPLLYCVLCVHKRQQLLA